MPAWYLPKGTIKSADENDLDKASSSCELWGGFCGALVIGGVIAEWLITDVQPPYETFLAASSYADAAVAIGIVGEVLLGMRNNRLQSELRARSNKRVEDALDRATRAETELIKFRTPRHSIFDKHRAEFTEKMKPFAGTFFDTGIEEGGEIEHFTWRLFHALHEAGWAHIAWADFSGMGRQQPPLPASGMVSATNVEIHIHPNVRAKLAPAAAALIAALRAMDIDVDDVGHNCHSRNIEAMHILVGGKA